MKRAKFLCAAALVAMLYTTGWAQLMVQETGVDPDKVVQVYSDLGHTSPPSVYAGVYQLSITGSGNLGLDGAVDAFCIDIAEYSPTSPVEYEASSLNAAPDPASGPMGEVRAGYLATLLDTYWTDWTASGNAVVGVTGTYTDDQIAAALQLAVWEIVDEFNTTSGVIEYVTPSEWTLNEESDRQFWATCTADSAVVPLANAMLSYVAGEGTSSFGSYLALTDDCKQDYVVKVPVPAAALLGLLGLSAAGLKLRKFA